LVDVLNFLTAFTEQPKRIQQRLCHFILTHTFIIIKISMKFVKIVPVFVRAAKIQLSNVISFLIQWKTTLYDTAEVFVQCKSSVSPFE